MIGETILGYTVNEKIGSGGFGTVYKVSKTNASGTYTRALKHITIPSQKQYVDVLNSMGGDYSKADDYFASVLKEIVNEIQIISSLSEAGTQNIVRYYENYIVETNSPKRYDIYILMELLTPFTDYMYNNLMTVKDVIKLGKDILTALVSCHEQNVIHRDIKDDNIFVSSDGCYKLGDFGVSKVLKDKSKAESMKGTPNFIAPEVYLGKGQYDATVDLYSLGIMLYKLLNKSRNPFLPSYPGTYNSDDEDVAFERRMKGEIPELPYDATNHLGEVIVKAILNRNERYNSAKEFLAALQEAEVKLSEEELKKTVNQVVSIPAASQSNKKESMNETIGMDSISTTVSGEKKTVSEGNLFETISDTFDKAPVKVEPVEFSAKERENYQDTVEKPLPKVERTYSSPINEPPRVEAITKKDLRWVAYILPVVIFLIIVVIYMVFLPKWYGKALNLGNWLVSNPEEILDFVQDPNAVFAKTYAIWGFKVLMWILSASFIASLFNLGRTLQNKKPDYNMNALMRDKEPFIKAMEINEEARYIKLSEAAKAKTAIRNVMEKLRNESAFGFGNDSVARCENDIVRSLQNIEQCLQALGEEKTVKEAAQIIIEDCKTIQNKLKVRTELKKK